MVIDRTAELTGPPESSHHSPAHPLSRPIEYYGFPPSIEFDSMRRRQAFIIPAMFWMLACSSPESDQAPLTADLSNPSWVTQYQDSTLLFVGMSVVNEDVVWVSGQPDAVVHTVNGGKTWSVQKIAQNDSLRFRDVHAFSPEEVVIASLGPGSLARLYRTNDAGESWSLVLQATEPDRWFDCFSFWDHRGFMAVSSNGGMIIMQTEDAGRSWSEVPQSAAPKLIPGEHVAAASGTCALAGAEGRGWITTRIPGFGTRVLHTSDHGSSWSASPTPVPSGREGEGLASAAFFDAANGVAIGRVDDPEVSNVAITNDGGITWQPGGRTVGGVVFGAAVVPGTSQPTLVSVSRDFGSQYSIDGGQTWIDIGEDRFWTVSFGNANAGWAAGNGRISRIANIASDPDV
ncbi:MAG: photosystem II stability/assembly factor-like uncharacterized protein [Rhodothermales bacterium]|jgi:photosystem II stability/assembly factor-like uncharacterized protein